MQKQKRLLVIGSSNIDHIIRLATFPSPGQTLMGRDYQTVLGGKGANQAVAASRLGAHVTFMSCVGSDLMGSTLVQSLEEDKINVSYINAFTDTKTGIAMIWLADNGENSIVTNPGANAQLTSDYITQHERAFTDVEALLIQLETPLEGIKTAITVARSRGILIALNPAPAKILPDELLACVDIITPNETEIKALTGLSVFDNNSAQKAANILHQKGIQHVFITRGKQGVYHSEHSNTGKTQGVNHDGFSVKSIDTTAAGDTFNGGLLAALLSGKSTADSITFAQAASALSVQTIGAMPSVPTQVKTTEFLKNHNLYCTT